jgi:hypothetical protein
MLKKTTSQRQQLKAATAKLKMLKEQLLAAKQASGIDDFIAVKITKNQARYERSHALGTPANGVGKFFMLVAVTAKKQEVLIPLSMASGKKTAGFMYIIEGTGESSIATTSVTPTGDEVSHITIGTLQFCKIPAGSTAVFRILVTSRGQAGKTYQFIISRLNYKLLLSEARYLQYLKPLPSKPLKFT